VPHPLGRHVEFLGQLERRECWVRVLSHCGDYLLVLYRLYPLGHITHFFGYSKKFYGRVVYCLCVRTDAPLAGHSLRKMRDRAGRPTARRVGPLPTMSTYMPDDQERIAREVNRDAL
jgi:hypothetical protein